MIPKPSLVLLVMPAHSRSKNGVASLAYVPGIHVFRFWQSESKSWMAGTSTATVSGPFRPNPFFYACAAATSLPFAVS